MLAAVGEHGQALASCARAPGRTHRSEGVFHSCSMRTGSFSQTPGWHLIWKRTPTRKRGPCSSAKPQDFVQTFEASALLEHQDFLLQAVEADHSLRTAGQILGRLHAVFLSFLGSRTLQVYLVSSCYCPSAGPSARAVQWQVSAEAFAHLPAEFKEERLPRLQHAFGWPWNHGSKPRGSHFGIGECTTHVRTYFSGWTG